MPGRLGNPRRVTHLSCKSDQIKMRDYKDRRVTPPKRVTSPTWGSPPLCTQALSRTETADGTLCFVYGICVRIFIITL